jgi:nanoRNase/pAp phosphatase (c-di-AMP/oligoRNAs hydrolase)
MEPKLNLAEILGNHRGERHVIVLHDFPDPDAIASAFAHRLISATFDIEVDIVYDGEISHQQNIALVRLLGIDLIRYDGKLDFGQYKAAVFVDNQGANVEKILSAVESANVPVLLVVDHHELQDRLKAEFCEIRKTGSTSTMYAEYLAQGVVELETARKDHVMVATALLHGILTDTDGFVRALAEDLEAAAFLSRFRDAEILEQIMNQARSKHAMDIIERALANRLIAESFSVAGIGYLRAEDRDAIAQAADFLLTEENVHTAIVYGMVQEGDQDETLIGSLRTRKLTLDPDAFIKDVLGKDVDGHFFGGGKPSAGGFAIPIGFLAGAHGPNYQGIKWQVYDQQIKFRIFAKIGADPALLEKEARPAQP